MLEFEVWIRIYSIILKWRLNVFFEKMCVGFFKFMCFLINDEKFINLLRILYRKSIVKCIVLCIL